MSTSASTRPKRRRAYVPVTALAKSVAFDEAPSRQRATMSPWHHAHQGPCLLRSGARRDRAVRVARSFGFVGHVEYRHVHSQTGGAQYGQGSTGEEDLLTVYAEAFESPCRPERFLPCSDPGSRARPSAPGSTSAHRPTSRGTHLHRERRDPRIAPGCHALYRGSGPRCLARQGNRGIAQPRGSTRGGNSAAPRTLEFVGVLL